jgi:hypothetical protein
LENRTFKGSIIENRRAARRSLVLSINPPARLCDVVKLSPLPALAQWLLRRRQFTPGESSQNFRVCPARRKCGVETGASRISPERSPLPVRPQPMKIIAAKFELPRACGYDRRS